MISLGRILKDYEDSGAMHALVSIDTAVGEGVFVTKGGDLVNSRHRRASVARKSWRCTTISTMPWSLRYSER